LYISQAGVQVGIIYIGETCVSLRHRWGKFHRAAFNDVVALEIKATSAPTSADIRHLVWLRDQLGARLLGAAILHTGPRAFELGEKIVAAPLATVWS
jgi:hypothetical protein